jgi:hypothetical protein
MAGSGVQRIPCQLQRSQPHWTTTLGLSRRTLHALMTAAGHWFATSELCAVRAARRRRRRPLAHATAAWGAPAAKVRSNKYVRSSWPRRASWWRSWRRASCFVVCWAGKKHKCSCAAWAPRRAVGLLAVGRGAARQRSSDACVWRERRNACQRQRRSVEVTACLRLVRAQMRMFAQCAASSA